MTQTCGRCQTVVHGPEFYHVEAQSLLAVADAVDRLAPVVSYNHQLCRMCFEAVNDCLLPITALPRRHLSVKD